MVAPEGLENVVEDKYKVGLLCAGCMELMKSIRLGGEVMREGRKKRECPTHDLDQ